jgi:hypothetical protein
MASDWAQNPAAQATCSTDVNLDLIADCVIANETFFAVFNSDGGRLSFLFMKDGKGVHQIIGPAYQFTTALSDRSLWQVEMGAAGDPKQVPGAFADEDAPWQLYTPILAEDGPLTFNLPDGSRSKTYQLSASGLEMDYRGKPAKTWLGLALDPWTRFSPGWGNRYSASEQSGRFTWQLKGGPSVTAQAEGGVILEFNITQKYMFGPEDPNQEFEPGHYVPFPMAWMEILLTDGDKIILKIEK